MLDYCNLIFKLSIFLFLTRNFFFFIINNLFIISFIGHGLHFKKDCTGQSKNKKKQPLRIPVFSILDSEEEYFPCVAFLNVGLGDMKDTCEEEDIPLIDSRVITPMEEDPSTKKGKPEEDIITVQDSNMGKEDWELYTECDSFWKDGQRLTDSWYGIEKVPNDGFDDICLQGLSNIENNDAKAITGADVNVAPARSEVPNDGQDDLCLQGLLNIENNVDEGDNDVIRSLRNISVNFDNCDDDDDDDNFNDEFNKLMEDYHY